MLSPGRLSVICLSSVMLVQAVVIFGNISTAFGTLALTSTEHFMEIVPGNPSVGVVKPKRGSKI